MGDRTTVQLDFSLVDEDIFEQRFYGFDDVLEIYPEGVIEGLTNEVNFGGYAELEEISKQGIPFTAWHGEGGNYDATEMVGVNGKFFAMPCLSGYGAAVPADTLVNSKQHTEWREIYTEYLWAYREARKQMFEREAFLLGAPLYKGG